MAVLKGELVKKFIWNILNWIDTNINHTIIDWLFDLFYGENKDGSDTLGYLLWKNTSYKFCCWVNIDLSERWFPEEWDKL
jgi:hypothetical protein